VKRTVLSEAAETLPSVSICTMAQLIWAAFELGAEKVDDFTDAERDLSAVAHESGIDLDALEAQIRDGHDPLGDAFCLLRSAAERRPQGQTYTPTAIVDAMVAWARSYGTPERVIDPGVGSGRYLMAAAEAFPDAELIGADLDPVAGLMARANLNTAGHAARSKIELTDYRSLDVPKIDGKTLYVGNPPYVRHHGISPAWKQWLTATAALYGYKASQLAGLHVHFFLATLQHADQGDYGSFVTSSEWLDVNYGSLVRNLVVDGLGGQSLHVVAPDAMPFSDAATTAAIACFEIGSKRESIRIQSVKELDKLGDLAGGDALAVQRLREAPRWTPLLRVGHKLPEGYVELGELARVHRGTVTGANRVWVTRRGETKLPDSVLKASITKAKELFAAGSALEDASDLRVVIDLPVDLDELDVDDRKKVVTFLRRPEVKCTKTGYVASNRRAWWSVGLRQPAPILATYMARRPPAFVRNLADARHINIAHGIYLRDSMGDAAVAKLADHLRVSVTLGQGRTYAGGLTKFEPREMERLPVPAPELLEDASFTAQMGRETPG